MRRTPAACGGPSVHADLNRPGREGGVAATCDVCDDNGDTRAAGWCCPLAGGGFRPPSGRGALYARKFSRNRLYGAVSRCDNNSYKTHALQPRQNPPRTTTVQRSWIFMQTCSLFVAHGITRRQSRIFGKISRHPTTDEIPDEFFPARAGICTCCDFGGRRSCTCPGACGVRDAKLAGYELPHLEGVILP